LQSENDSTLLLRVKNFRIRFENKLVADLVST